MNQVIIENIGFLRLSPQQINESIEKNNGLLIVPNVLLSTADEENGNGRTYPMQVLREAIDRYMEKVRFGNAYGACDHEDEPEVKLQTASHRIVDIRWVGNKVYGDIEILDSPEFNCGRIIGGLLRRNMPVGISSRSVGSVRNDGDKTIVESLEISCYDFVSNPSNHNSFAKLSESLGIKLQPSNSKYDKINAIIKDILSI
jgi:Prohead core protein serine protease